MVEKPVLVIGEIYAKLILNPKIPNQKDYIDLFETQILILHVHFPVKIEKGYEYYQIEWNSFKEEIKSKYLKRLSERNKQPIEKCKQHIENDGCFIKLNKGTAKLDVPKELIEALKDKDEEI